MLRTMQYSFQCLSTSVPQAFLCPCGGSPMKVIQQRIAPTGHTATNQKSDPDANRLRRLKHPM
jgi:hypothetical protein